MNDELIDTMNYDVTSQEFIYQRVREMFEEIIQSERKVLLEKLSSQYAFLKMEFGRIEQDKRKLTVDLQFCKKSKQRKKHNNNHKFNKLNGNLINKFLPFLIWDNSINHNTLIYCKLFK